MNATYSKTTTEIGNQQNHCEWVREIQNEIFFVKS